jgi:DNA-binding transcriptional ArsR family regulator
MSHHFRVLREAGLVHTRSEGPVHMNTLRRDELGRRFPGLLDAVLRAVTLKAGG